MFYKLGIVVGIATGLTWALYADANKIDNLILVGGWFLCVYSFMTFGKIIDNNIKKL